MTRNGQMITMSKGFIAILLFAALSVCSSVTAQTATITWTEVHQTIEGFGASSAYTGGNLTSAQADLFFSPTLGVGLSLLRTEVPTDGSYGETQTMQQAIARASDLKIWSTPISPPASMKSNGSTICNTGSGNASLLTTSYGAYATYLSNYISGLRSNFGINLYALSLANEPDYCPSAYDGAVWSGTALHDFVLNNLGPTFLTNGQNGVRVMMPETSTWADLPSYGNPTFTDPAAAALVSIAASHDYDYFNCAGNPSTCAYPNAQAIGKSLWETEVSSLTAFDPSITDALVWAQDINDWMTVANANAWNWWWLIGVNNDNEGIMNNTSKSSPPSGVIATRLYAIGNYSKFVRPGWVRIGATATPVSGVSISAYKNPVTGDFAIVAINHNTSSTSMNFALNGFTSAVVTPWVTSGSLNLVQQSNISVNSSSFDATLPPSSVTTFVASAALSGSGNKPNSPTITSITAH